MRVATQSTHEHQAAVNCLLASLDRGCVAVLRGSPGTGKSGVLQAIHRLRGGLLLEARDFTVEDAFLSTVEQAIVTRNLLLIDDLHLICALAGPEDYARSYLLDAALTAILADAGVFGCKLVFAVEDEAPWPIQRRAVFTEVGARAAAARPD